MTCQELRLYLEDPLRPDVEFSAEAEHLAHCLECARFVEAHRELGAGLRLLREAAPQPSPELDATVLVNYRRQITEQPAPQSVAERHGFALVGWSAIAAAVALAALLLLGSPQTTNRSNATSLAQQTAVSRPLTPIRPANRQASASTAPYAKRTRPHILHHQRSLPRVVSAETPVAQDFRSLMYCDPFSCGGAMQVIRLQLPASAAAFEPGAGSSNNPTYADVLIGSDGIARGIRIVQ
jgi:hypothetical protein